MGFLNILYQISKLIYLIGSREIAIIDNDELITEITEYNLSNYIQDSISDHSKEIRIKIYHLIND